VNVTSLAPLMRHI